ncbi:MAG TPA: cytidine deaminase [Ferruginibacter sp.]|nr:cytidine deaminase [Ferruginibacter sp.]HPH90034.1 cytidine deaminase [Ferruginibacter sp.]
MELKKIQLSIEVYRFAEELQTGDAELLSAAREITAAAYAPYSQFFVGAAARLANGAIVKGTNQENASYPVAICAERTLMSAAATLYPGVAIEAMAISYDNKNGKSNKPISPCGVCRQMLTEFEDRTGREMKIIMSGQKGEVYIVNTARELLPLTFTSVDLKG